MKLGFLFAGQGSQHPGMGKDLYEAYPAFRAVLDAAEPGFDLKQVCFEDDGTLLNQTRYTQPCMVAFAAGITAVLRENGITPYAAVGLSLGEYSALHAAGVLEAQAAINMTAFRGRAMEEAAQGHDPAMYAVMGAEPVILAGLCQQASSDEAIAAVTNLNCPGQTVIGGDRAAVEAVVAAAKEHGVRRCVPLKVSGPFHTPLMSPAGDALEGYFKNVDFKAPEFPVVFNCTAQILQPGEEIPALLVRQVQSTVRMEESLRTLAEMGVEEFIEIGPGKALSGFVRKTLPGMPVRSIETAQELADFLAEYGGNA